MDQILLDSMGRLMLRIVRRGTATILQGPDTEAFLFLRQTFVEALSCRVWIQGADAHVDSHIRWSCLNKRLPV